MTTRERIGQAADRAGWTVARYGIFDTLTRGSSKITIMYTGNGAVLRAALYLRGSQVVPSATVSSSESGKATTVINWMAP